MAIVRARTCLDRRLFIVGRGGGGPWDTDDSEGDGLRISEAAWKDTLLTYCQEDLLPSLAPVSENGGGKEWVSPSKLGLGVAGGAEEFVDALEGESCSTGRGDNGGVTVKADPDGSEWL